MSKEHTYHIRPVLNGETLGSAVRILLRDISWKEAKQLVTTRKVQVNGNLCLDDARRVKTGDVVKIHAQSRAPVPTEQDVRIRHLDADLVVIEKPAGITTLRHPEEREWDDRRKSMQPTLEEVVQRVVAKVTTKPESRAGGTKGRPPHSPHRPKPPKVRAVHRLDRDTSGLMLFAISPRAEQALIELFKTHAITRSYLAVVHGKVEARTIETFLARDRGDGLRGSSARGADDPDAQRAVTHVRPIEHLADRYTIVECTLETGRTHQIRIHLSEIGHMLCGEKVYTRTSPGSESIKDTSGAPRQALHSARLVFNHPMTGQSMSFKSDWPKELASWLDKLRKGVG